MKSCCCWLCMACQPNCDEPKRIAATSKDDASCRLVYSFFAGPLFRPQKTTDLSTTPPNADRRSDVVCSFFFNLLLHLDIQTCRKSLLCCSHPVVPFCFCNIDSLISIQEKKNKK